MSYDRQHVLMTWGGPLATTEQWSCGVRFAALPNGDPAPPTDVTGAEFTALRNQVDEVWARLTTWFQSGNAGAAIGSLAQLSWCKLALITEGGDYADEPASYETTPVNPPTTTQLPPQCAYVVSLRSGLSLGRANYGRFYVPVPTWAPGQNGGLATEAQAASARTAAKTMLKGVEADLQVVVSTMRLVIMSNLGFGHTKLVSQLGVGRVVDTQRRRRNKLNEGTALVSFLTP